MPKATNINHSSKDEYLKEMNEQNQKDAKILVKTVEELIDVPMFGFAEFCEGKNRGELLAFRSLLQTNLDQADILGKKLVENKLSGFNAEERIKVGSVFAIAAKIQDRMGYIDYLLKRNEIQ